MSRTHALQFSVCMEEEDHGGVRVEENLPLYSIALLTWARISHETVLLYSSILS